MADNGDEVIVENGQVGITRDPDDVVATTDAVAAAVFGLKGAFSQHVAMEANAFQNQLGSERFILGKGGGIKTAGGISEDDRDEKRREDFALALDLMADQARERKEWSMTESTLADVTMTGANWELISDSLSNDTDARKLLLAQMIADGYSEEEANQMVDEIALAARGQSMPKGDRTPDMNAAIDKVNQDPALGHYLGIAQQNSLNATKPEIEGATSAPPQSMKLSQTQFSSAPNLSSHHASSLAATTPLDGARIAAEAPPPANAIGLDI